MSNSLFDSSATNHQGTCWSVSKKKRHTRELGRVEINCQRCQGILQDHQEIQSEKQSPPGQLVPLLLWYKETCLMKLVHTFIIADVHSNNLFLQEFLMGCSRVQQQMSIPGGPRGSQSPSKPAFF